jgi:hypothetical protein
MRFSVTEGLVCRVAHREWAGRPFWEWPTSGATRPILTVMGSIIRVQLAQSITPMTVEIVLVVPELCHFQNGCLVNFS